MRERRARQQKCGGEEGPSWRAAINKREREMNDMKMQAQETTQQSVWTLRRGRGRETT